MVDHGWFSWLTIYLIMPTGDHRCRWTSKIILRSCIIVDVPFVSDYHAAMLNLSRNPNKWTMRWLSLGLGREQRFSVLGCVFVVLNVLMMGGRVTATLPVRINWMADQEESDLQEWFENLTIPVEQKRRVSGGILHPRVHWMGTCSNPRFDASEDCLPHKWTCK